MGRDQEQNIRSWSSSSSSSSSYYYDVLGVRPDASIADIRAAYRKLALKWHPDRCKREPWVQVDEAKRRFQQIQEAYQVLSDENKKRLYDVGLYDPQEEEEEEEEEVEGFSEFVEEMVDLMANVRREKKEYSLVELQQMLLEMVEGFHVESCSPPPISTFDSGTNKTSPTRKSTKRFRCDENPTASMNSHLHVFV